MTFTLIEINDYTLTVSDGTDIKKYMGFAAVLPSEVLFDCDAFSQIKLKPNSCYSQYWQRLSYEKINSDNPRVQHFADLAFLQLKFISQTIPTDRHVIFVVPSDYQQKQLSLLLGIASNCELNVITIFDRAALYLSHINQQQNVAFADINLHQSTVTCANLVNTVNIKATEVIADKGYLNLVILLANWCNELFIQHYRFDVFYSAATEQSLFCEVKAMLGNRSNGWEQLHYDIEIANKKIQITKKALNDKLNHFFSYLVKQKNTVYISTRLAKLLEHTQVMTQVNYYDDKDLYQQVKSHYLLIDQNSGVSLINSLPCNSNIDKKIQAQDRPTHLLQDHRAYKLTGENTYLLLNLDDKSPIIEISATHHDRAVALICLQDHQLQLKKLTTHNININQKQLTDTAVLAIGDQIALSPIVVLTLISVDH